MEVQRGADPCARPHSWEVMEPGFKLSVLDQGLPLFSNISLFPPSDNQ